jgi:ubiquinone/menaquinone biosynthesis C-methylase UbiE
MLQNESLSCLSTGRDRTLNSWVVEQLHLQTHQHVLQIGYGQGLALQQVARKLRDGFIAGIDESVDHYQAARRRNRRDIDSQHMQLHLGSIGQLPYPHHYFHTIFGNNIYQLWKEPQYSFLQLYNLLRSGGRLVMVFQPHGAKTEAEVWRAAEAVQQQYIEAGFADIRISFREMHPVTAICVVGVRE